MRLASALALALAVLSVPALAQEAPAKDLKVDAKALGGPPKAPQKAPQKAQSGRLSREQMMQKAAEVSRGYYTALIEGQFETAASFLHPDMVERTRKVLVDEVEKAPDAKQKATLTALGVPDLNTLRTMPAGKFFATYARSSYGVGLQALSGKDVLTLRPVVEDQSCFPERGFCAVTLRLKGKRQDHSAISVVNKVVVLRANGRWLVNDQPPTS